MLKQIRMFLEDLNGCGIYLNVLVTTFAGTGLVYTTGEFHHNDCVASYVIILRQ